MDAESKRMEAMTAKFMAGQKLDMQTIGADMKDHKTVDQTLDEILTPDQKDRLQANADGRKNSQAEMMASSQMTQVAPLLQLNDAQKDQVESALYQVQLDSRRTRTGSRSMRATWPRIPLAYPGRGGKSEGGRAGEDSHTGPAGELSAAGAKPASALQRTMMQKIMPLMPQMGGTARGAGSGHARSDSSLGAGFRKRSGGGGVTFLPFAVSYPTLNDYAECSFRNVAAAPVLIGSVGALAYSHYFGDGSSWPICRRN